MRGYTELAKMSVFSINDVEKLVWNKNTAYSLVNRLVKNGLAIKIRSRLYTCIEPQSNQPIASKYQIATAINESAYISHHTAFEYYGQANQVYYEVYVSSNSHFRDFEFNGFLYKFVQSKFSNGVISPKNTEGVRITDIERTVVDSIKDFDKIGGLEELLSCIEILTFLDSQKLLQYLYLYDLQVLYQKSGYILEHFKDSLKLPESFFEICKSKVGKSIRYLSSSITTDTAFNKEWKLVVPQNLFDLNEQGGDELV